MWLSLVREKAMQWYLSKQNKVSVSSSGALQTVMIAQTNTKRVLLCVSIGLGFLLAAVLTVQAQTMVAFAATCDEICADTLRLHVRANSDTKTDQALKLMVRDAVLKVMDELYQDELQQVEALVTQGAWHSTLICDANKAKQTIVPIEAQSVFTKANLPNVTLTKAQSIAMVSQNLQLFADTATKTLAAQGVNQPVTVYLTEEFFTTTVYDAFTLPAGQYTALRVEIGQAAGKNWWCVLYPALCLSSASGGYQSTAENDLICGDYALRFAAVEWYQTHFGAGAAK